MKHRDVVALKVNKSHKLKYMNSTVCDSVNVIYIYTYTYIYVYIFFYKYYYHYFSLSDVAEAALDMVMDETKNGEVFLVSPKRKEYVNFPSFMQ